MTFTEKLFEYSLEKPSIGFFCNSFMNSFINPSTSSCKKILSHYRKKSLVFSLVNLPGIVWEMATDMYVSLKIPSKFPSKSFPRTPLKPPLMVFSFNLQGTSLEISPRLPQFGFIFQKQIQKKFFHGLFLKLLP